MGRFFRFAGLTVLFVLLVTAVAFSAPERPETLDLGADAPDFNLLGVDGKNYTLADFSRADILVVIFTANHCPTAQAYENRFIKLTNDYKDKGVAVVCISSNDPRAVRLDELAWTDVGDSFEDMKIRAQDKGFNFPYLYDGDKLEAAWAYGPVTTPHTFIFDKARKLKFVGRIDNSEWREKPDAVTDARNAIDALLAGEEVPVKKTKTFGCSIKWSDKQESVKKEAESLAAEEVTVKTIDTKGIKELVKNDSKKLRLINVWASWCGPCVVEFPELVKIHWIYRNRKTTEFELVTISADPQKNREGVLKFLKKFKASSNNFHYNSDNVYELIEAVDPKWAGAIPYTILVKPGGEVIYRQMGMIDPLEVKRKIHGYYSDTLPWWVSEE